MFGQHISSHDDDEDIEIVDLDDLNEANMDVYQGEWELEERRDHQERAEQWHQEHQTASTQHSVRHSLHTPRFSTRHRVMQVSITSCLVLGVVLAVIFGNAPTRSKVLSLIQPAISATPAQLQTRYFYVAGDPPWGHLYIDGKLIAHPPDPATRQNPPLILPQGRHVLVWTAEPFFTQGCTMTEPPNPRLDTCKYTQFIASTAGIGARLFSFPASLLGLTSDEQGSLESEIQTALSENSPSTKVLPGESYAVDSAGRQIAVAHVPLRATLHYYLDTNLSNAGVCSTPLELNLPCIYDGQECHTLCSVQLYPDGSDAWNVLVVVQAAWDYTTLSGQTVALAQPEIKGASNLFEHFMPFRITWDGAHWGATLSFSMLPPDLQQFFDPACNAAMNHTRIDPMQRYIQASNLGTSWRYVSMSNRASGCLGMVTLNKGPNAPPDASLPVAYCLHRFGVFVAANALAHKYWPNLPLADDYEQQLAQHLAASYQQIE